MKHIKRIIDVLQWDRDIGRALVTFPDMPGYAIEVQAAAVSMPGMRMIAFFARIEFDNHVVENVLPCIPNDTVHCGEGLSQFFQQSEFDTALLRPVLKIVKDLTDRSLKLRPVGEATLFEQNVQRVLGKAFTQD